MSEKNDLIPGLAMELFDAAEENLPKKILKYSESVRESLLLNDMNLQDRAYTAMSIHHGYVNCLFAEKRVLKKLEIALDKAEEDYIARYGDKHVPRFKTQQEAKLSVEVKRIENMIAEQKEIIAYLNEVCSIMSKYGFTVKNAVDLQRIIGM